MISVPEGEMDIKREKVKGTAVKPEGNFAVTSSDNHEETYKARVHCSNCRFTGNMQIPKKVIVKAHPCNNCEKDWLSPLEPEPEMIAFLKQCWGAAFAGLAIIISVLYILFQ